jgi:hypothetical protein
VSSPSSTPGWLSARPIVIFAGAFGSGKTEIAINYGLAARAHRSPIAIVDLDIVTPYFRIGDYRGELERRGLRVVAPEGELTSAELPALSPELAGVLRDPSLHVVIDAGGSLPGARLLAAFADQIKARGCDLWMVVNPFRPAAASPSAVAAEARATEAASLLRLTGLVANPNLGPITKQADVQRGLTRIVESAESLSLPIAFLAAEASLLQSEEASALPRLPLNLTVRLPWHPLRGGQEGRDPPTK